MLATGGWQGGNAGYWADRWQSDAGGGGGGGGGGHFNATPFTPPAPWSPTAPPFSMAPFSFHFDPNEDPSAKFVRDEALGATQRGAAARGVLNTGGTLKDLQDRAANLGSTEYQNAFLRALEGYQTNASTGLAQNQNAFYQGLTTNQNAFDQYYRTNALNFNQGLLANQTRWGQDYDLAQLGLTGTLNDPSTTGSYRPSPPGHRITASSYTPPGTSSYGAGLVYGSGGEDEATSRFDRSSYDLSSLLRRRSAR